MRSNLATLLVFAVLLTVAGIGSYGRRADERQRRCGCDFSGVAFGLAALFTKAMTLELAGADRLTRASNRFLSLRVRHARRQHRRDCHAAELVSFGARDHRDAAVGSPVEYRADRRRDDRVRRTIAGGFDGRRDASWRIRTDDRSRRTAGRIARAVAARLRSWFESPSRASKPKSSLSAPAVRAHRRARGKSFPCDLDRRCCPRSRRRDRAGRGRRRPGSSPSWPAT